MPNYVFKVSDGYGPSSCKMVRDPLSDVVRIVVGDRVFYVTVERIKRLVDRSVLSVSLYEKTG